MQQIILVGGGSGTAEYFLPAAYTALEQVDIIVASKRFLSFLPKKQLLPLENLSEFLEQLPVLLEKNCIGVVVSGDPLMYSLYRTIQQRYPEIPMQIIPGIGSLQLLGAAFGLTMEDAAIYSIHGRAMPAGKIAYAVTQHPVTFFFCSKMQGPREIAAALAKYQVKGTTLYTGSDLTYPEQQLWQGAPESYPSDENPALCVAAVYNPRPRNIPMASMLPDSAFLRNASPMTKEEVRAVILSKLHLTPDTTVWDIGAGTGSISVECARMCPFGCVYAVEYRAEALEILEKNKAYFQLSNMQIISGRAESLLETLPTPDRIFIGGSGGALPKIVEKICQYNRPIRLVISAVTLETQAQLYPILSKLPSFEVVQLSVGYGKPVGKYHVINYNHPVMLFSCETRRES